LIDRRRLDSEGRRVNNLLASFPVPKNEHRRRRRSRELVKSIVAEDNNGVISSASLQYTQHFWGHGGIRHTHKLANDSAGVRQWPEEVEHRGNPQLPAGRCGMAKGRMESRRKAKADARLGNATGNSFRRDIQLNAKRLQDVGRTGSRTGGATTVFAYDAASSSNHKRRGCRDVDAVATVATSSARANCRCPSGFIKGNRHPEFFHCG
jgi:hypothetical protein